jgi:hypothetical protein
LSNWCPRIPSLGPPGKYGKRESPPEGPVHYSPYSKHLFPRLSPPEEGGKGVLKKGKSERRGIKYLHSYTQPIYVPSFFSRNNIFGSFFCIDGADIMLE